MLAQLEHKHMSKESPILVRLFKEEAELEVWKKDSSGRFALLKTYPICRWSGELGPKISGRRPSGAGRILYCHTRADESQFSLLSLLRYRLPERF